MSTSTSISKRLHISFTPSVPANGSEELAKSLKAHFSKFGTVKSIDGLGKLDGVGLPRKFGYVNIEGSEASITKCVNALSGSIWKGVKVRVGDARPDFAQKIAQENASDAPPPRLKRKRGGVLAEDMSLVTPDSAPKRRGWKVSEMGRITHPARMRPGHPLPPPLATTVPKTKTKDLPAKPKKRRDPDSRARRKTIDMTRWGSVHLSGMFLDNVGQGVPVREEAVEEASSASDSDADLPPPVPMAQVKPPSPPPVVVKAAPPTAPPPIPQSQTTSDAAVDLAKEKSQTLSFLESLFAERDEQWGGRESVDSDVDEKELLKIGGPAGTNEDDGIEFVPMEVDGVEPRTRVVEDEEEEVEVAPSPPPPPAKLKPTKLKDLFVSREEEAGFSLLSHLDLDLELDEELAHVIPSTTAEATTTLQQSPPAPVQTTFISSSHVQITLDPKQPLFFPLLSSFAFASPSSSFTTKARQRDILDVGKDNGWNAHFYRSETDEEIRKKWQEQKVELTRGWNKRWREAGKVRRRRGGVDGE